MNHPHLVRGTFGFLWLFFVALVLGACTHAPSSAPAPCQTRHLLLAFDKSGVGLSNEGTQFVLVNQSKESCTLSGYPALQLLDVRHQPIPAQVRQSTTAYLYSTQAPHRFVLQAGEKAFFVVEWANLGCGKIPPAAYASPVSFLRVTPPLNQASLQAAVQFCSFRNYVEISPLEPNQILGVFG